ncbi:MAG TPA: hypothetical protein VK487_09810 [Candidatus Bathyarchaeia archaeon]|nr:hypothetical protein [Candidatus Bathyarchaeia archaeon]
MTKIEAIKEQSGIYSVAFPIFSGDDILLLKRATDPVAQEVSASIAAHKKELDSAAQHFSSFDQVGSAG